MAVEARDVGVLKGAIGCGFVRYGYVEEREKVGKFAGFVAHVCGIEYFCDQCEVGDGGEVHGPYVCVSACYRGDAGGGRWLSGGGLRIRGDVVRRPGIEDSCFW